jgi:D-glycero-alpha-D-manno-heptose-7-phosphate kinase
MTVRARAPLRLGLGGGGTDLPEFSARYGGVVLNATIDLYAHATIVPLDEPSVRFEAVDLGESASAAAATRLEPDGKLDLHKGVYNRIVADFNGGEPLRLDMKTYSDVPAGSGLGSSSTLIVAMVKAYVEWLNLPLDEYEIAGIAYQIERGDLGLSGGKQDQYAAAFGGFNLMEFGAGDRVIVNPLRIKNWIICELESSLVLYHSGVSRESAAIIDQQSRNITEQDARSLEGLMALKESAITMKESILRGELDAFAAAMERSWHSKKETAERISSPAIETAYEVAIGAGALAGKVSGAGGGGFMMFLVDPTRRIEVMGALEALEGRVYPCHFTKRGVEGWRIL